MFCQAFRFLAGKMNDCPMFGRSKVSSPHHSLVKLSQRSEMYEVGSFTESEIMNLLPVHIIHQHPSILTNAFPQIRSFARRGFRIIPTGIIFVITVYPIRNSLLDTGAPIVRNVKHVIFISYTGNIRIDSRNLLIGILKKKLR